MHIPRGEVCCPRCGAATEVAYLGSLEIDRCRSCRGIWLDKGELSQLRDLADDQSLRDGVRMALGEARPGRHNTTSTYIACPVCTSPMTRRNHLNVSGIIIDRCEEHGTWLDHDDAVRLFELITSGDEPRLRQMSQRANVTYVNERLRRIEELREDQSRQIRRQESMLWALLIWSILD